MDLGRPESSVLRPEADRDARPNFRLTNEAAERAPPTGHCPLWFFSNSSLEFLTGKTRSNQVKFRCDCNPDSESGLLGELSIED
jgi:hypothetical protein